MKFALCIVVLTIMVSVEAVPTPGIELPSSDPDYFKENLKSVQGAIKDTLRAGQDLEDMEKMLQNIVNLSSNFWRAESATEYATDSNAYENGWKSDVPQCTNTDNGALDMDGVSCLGYHKDIPEDCGEFDDDDFKANEMCCACKTSDQEN